MKTSEFERPEDYITDNPSLVLYFLPEEEEYKLDEDDLEMRCFVKEYPDIDPDKFMEAWEKTGEYVNEELEEEYGTLDVTGLEYMMGWDAADYAFCTYDKYVELFDKIVEYFESII